MSANLLIYDLPERLHIPNPSGRLRRHGVRLNLSCWMVLEEYVPWSLLNGLREQGAIWHMVAFSEEEAGKLAEMARSSLERDAAAALVRMEKSITATGGKLLDKGNLDAYAAHVELALKRVQKLLADLEAGAKSVGIEPGFRDHYTRADAIQAAAHERARQYAEMTERLREIAHETTHEPRLLSIVDAARSDEVPAGVLFDAAEEEGIDTGAARASFGG